MITVWGRISSSNVQAVMWCLDELNVPCERRDAGFTYGVVDTDEYRAMNPNGTVPTLVDGTMPPLFETGAILRYLASRYGDYQFWPADLAARAEVDKWAEWAKINIALGFTGPLFWRVVRTAPRDRDPDLVARNLVALTRYLKIADAQLRTHPFIAGAEFTIADIQMGHCLYRYYDIALDRPDLPYLRAYYDRLCQRPAYGKHVMVDYSELAVTD